MTGERWFPFGGEQSKSWRGTTTLRRIWKIDREKRLIEIQWLGENGVTWKHEDAENC
ncbi:hypothetical protein OsI_30522 [Oryza sativa Indica Group]|uniref:Uncharacterized protein n=1 Tax=Oryza sativa subsp. indica TaxID=39946 RepID=A2YYV9_ORYSI|nr:hypothetical protein OsI_30522 [Oryza sativa Indica Group]